MNKKPYFITTPIYYVNDVPHIGHAYTTVAADVLARWKRAQGDQVVLLVGTDEHGAKIAEAAEQHGKSPQTYTGEVVNEFKNAWQSLDIKYDRFIRTSDADHEVMATKILQKLYDKGFIAKGVYEGLYCVGHEKFMSPEELIDGKCPDHGKAPEPYKEENYFFTLSKFQNQLIGKIESDEVEIKPLERKNEILGKLRQGLQDISISRTKVKWAIPLPFDESQTVYVWIEALINYYTYGKPSGYWPADLHLVGKDILWFHAVVWPAILLAISDELPKKVFAHGFFTIGGQKISKTLGNVITPQELVDKFGVDGTRYLLLSAFPFGADGDFNWAKLTEKYNADLANGVGNLLSRFTTVFQNTSTPIGGKIIIPSSYRSAMEKLDFYQAVQIINKYVKEADASINEAIIWKQSPAEREQYMALSATFSAEPSFDNFDIKYRAFWVIRRLSELLRPFMPETANLIEENVGSSTSVASILKIHNLFPRK